MRRDDQDVYHVGPAIELPAAPRIVIDALIPVVTERRAERLRGVAANRSRRVVPVLEGLVDPHNTSAILRSCDAFGWQEVQVVDGPQGFLAAHRVAKGSHKWLDVIRHESTSSCFESLRARGYEILVAVMGGEVGPRDLAARGKVAIVFGNEHRGASDEALGGADGSYAIPMAGFVESLNVSVAAAITLHAARRAPETAVDAATPAAENDCLGRTAKREHDELLARFLFTSVPDADRIVRKAMKDHGDAP